MTCHVCVVVHTPAHSQVSGPLTYGSARPLAPGTLVRVPLGKRETLGVVWDSDPHAPPPPATLEVKPVASVLDALAPLPAAWRDLVAFSARYYQRSLGEVRRNYPDLVAQRYKLDAETLALPPYELLEAIGRKRGLLVRGGEVNTERCAIMLVDEFRACKWGRISLERPPQRDDLADFAEENEE